ncbi:hypothetical protein [Xanthomonas citri]|uniref:hypothetical protein n=1 Tax=Xanthomonas citri TaxID=346 RepID=UPI0011AFB50B|nr:hypothetical protein [Xanthomonas citri]
MSELSDAASIVRGKDKRRRLTVRLAADFPADRTFLVMYDQMLQDYGTNACGDFLRRCILEGYKGLINQWECRDTAGFARFVESLPGPGADQALTSAQAIDPPMAPDPAVDDAVGAQKHSDTQIEKSHAQKADNALLCNNESSSTNSAGSSGEASGDSHPQPEPAEEAGLGIGKRLVTGLLGQGNTR